MDVSMLLQAARCGKSLATFWTSMAASTYVGGSDMPLQIAWICKYFVAIFTGKSPKLAMYHLVPQKVWPPSKSLAAMFAYILVRLIAMAVHHVFVQSKQMKISLL